MWIGPENTPAGIGWGRVPGGGGGGWGVSILLGTKGLGALSCIASWCNVSILNTVQHLNTVQYPNSVKCVHYTIGGICWWRVTLDNVVGNT